MVKIFCDTKSHEVDKCLKLYGRLQQDYKKTLMSIGSVIKYLDPYLEKVELKEEAEERKRANESQVEVDTKNVKEYIVTVILRYCANFLRQHFCTISEKLQNANI